MHSAHINIFPASFFPYVTSELLYKINTDHRTAFRRWRKTISGLCVRRERKRLLESLCLCRGHPRVTSIAVNLLPSLGALMRALIRGKQESKVWCHLNEYRFSPDCRTCGGLLCPGRASGRRESNLRLQSSFSPHCWQFLRRKSDDYFTSKNNGNSSKIPSLEVTIKEASARSHSEPEFNPIDGGRKYFPTLVPSGK